MSKIPNKDRIDELSEKWLNNTISETEKQEYDSWYNSFKDHEIQDLTREYLTDFLDKKYEFIKEREGINEICFSNNRVKKLKRAVLVAASICFVAFFFYSSFYEQKKVIEEVHYSSILPGTDRATLVIDNGQVFNLDSLKKGEFLEESGVRIEKTDAGELIYSVLDPSVLQTVVRMNTVSTPRGGQYRISLPDGSKVWLNAESSLTFPSVFTQEDRIVKLSGEAYFEVVENKQFPFKVITENEEVEVLGTHFNVNSYKGSEVSSVALLEGKVKVSVSSYDSRILSPGQQSLVKNGKIQIYPIDLYEAVAWKNGEFMFNNESLKSVMQKMARWYDVDIVIAPELEDVAIWGSVSRYDDFGKVLRIIELTNDNIQIKVVGRRVLIMK